MRKLFILLCCLAAVFSLPLTLACGEEGWSCPGCGRMNTLNYCPTCGSSRSGVSAVTEEAREGAQAVSGEMNGKLPEEARTEESLSFALDSVLAEQLGMEVSALRDSFVPSSARPMNACLVVSNDSESAKDQTEILKIREAGLMPVYTDYIKETMTAFTKASGGLIRFVGDPQQADLLFCVRTYYGNGKTYRRSGYASTVTGYSGCLAIEVIRLTGTRSRTSQCWENRLRNRETVNWSMTRFWKELPVITNSDKTKDMVNTILSWYGFPADRPDPESVTALQEQLSDHLYLEKNPDGVFDVETAVAVRRLQEDAGIPVTGVVNRLTLLSAYYSREEAEAAKAAYPELADEAGERGIMCPACKWIYPVDLLYTFCPHCGVRMEEPAA